MSFNYYNLANLKKKKKVALAKEQTYQGGSDMTSSKFRTSVQFNVNLTVG